MNRPENDAAPLAGGGGVHAAKSPKHDTPIAPDPMSTAMDSARDLLRRGLPPIPVPYRSKAATLTGWTKLRLSEDDLPNYFGQAPTNIGALFGEAAGWIVDVDLDHPCAVALADAHLPPTGATWGHHRKPRSHRLYRVTAPVDTRKWRTTGGASVVELRANGCQTIAPGSVRPDGALVRWDDDGAPATVTPDELVAAIEALAAAVRLDLGEEPEAKLEPKPPPRDYAHARMDGPSAYGRAALDREAADVAATGEGGRNDRLNVAAFNIGTLAGGGEVDAREAEAVLLDAARQAGLPDHEARATIASGMRSGERHPRQRPQTRPSGTWRQAANDAPREAPMAFAPISGADLIAQYAEMRPVVIDGLLREGETLNLVSTPKVGKSWLVHALAVAVVTGKPWLDKATTPGRVLLIDGELHRETLAKRLRRTVDTLGVTPDALALLDVLPVRGQRLTIDHVADALRDVPPGTYRLIVLDALYRFLPLGGEENANETMTQIYNTLDAIANRAKAAVVAVHHASKGNQSERSVTDVGSGAGAQSRAADTHLVLRAHEEEGAVVVDAAVRSFPPMDSFVIRSTNPGWELAPDLLPTQLKRAQRRGRTPREPATQREPEREWTPEEFAAQVVGRERTIREGVIARAKSAGLSQSKATALLKLAEAQGIIHRTRDGPNGAHRFTTEPPTVFEGEGAGP
ncbi:MAG: hypothetical protein DYG94_07110 [Leptolyngbya sp. PLA3]|nr:MAG: hypothetical protein EDM82_06875 [Cyanobacteria bacterium CYA]MCE7968497.1 hypothetical protein [Leptolyngbya sp. PL-A3]